jgi:hypothetical protein
MPIDDLGELAGTSWRGPCFNRTFEVSLMKFFSCVLPLAARVAGAVNVRSFAQIASQSVAVSFRVPNLALRGFTPVPPF